MSPPVRVALLGFSSFERTALATCFRLAGVRQPHYAQVTDLEQAELLVADADHAPSVALVQATDRLADTVFIGTQPPEQARAWMARPIDPLHVMRELDAIVVQRAGAHGRAPAALSALPALPALSAPAARPAEPTAPPPTSAPAPPQAMLSASPPKPPRGRRAPPEPARERHALLVDDSAIATLYLQKCLQVFGLHICTAANSGRATLLMSQQRFDFVFLDVELGDDSPMDGLALCQQIRRHPVHHGEQAPVVVLVSAHHRELDRVRGTLAGCDAYLAKPLQQAELDKLLRRHGVKPAQPEQLPGG
jgi:CheY-like chemotaxis protein